MKNKKYYYHFTGSTLRNGAPIPKRGKWLVHFGPVVPCEQGLHASAHPFDALRYAPGEMLHLVELDGDITKHGDPVDKVVARRRKIVKTINATDLLRRFARRVALNVVTKHWKDAPDVVIRYLKTGDESLRDAARDAACDAARDAARDAACDAARDAACDAARDAAWVAARAAARDAACDAARDAARDAACDAACDAARDAAWVAARAAARDAACDAARDAARDAAIRKHRRLFAKMVREEFAKH